MAIVVPNPVSAGSVHVDAPLSDFATAYQNNGFIADKLLPPIPVTKRSDKFFTRGRRDVSHIVSDLAGPGVKSNRATYEVSTDNYSVTDRSLHDLIDYAMEQNADAPLSPEQMSVNNIMQKLSLARESRVATMVCSTGSYAAANTGAVSAVWSNITTSTPISDINTAIAAIPFSGEDASLVSWCTLPVWNALRKHPEILALKGVTTGQVTRAEFASYFELDEFLVTNLFTDSANIGLTASYGRLFTATQFGILRRPKMLSGPDLSVFGVTFRVKPGIESTSWEEPSLGPKGSKAVQVSFADDEKIVQNDMGYLLTSVL
jgi:hypothetical protein